MSAGEGMAARDHALRVAVLSALKETVDKAHKTARAEAEPAFKTARGDGQTQQKVLLPDGEEIGLISIRGGSPVITMPEAGFEAWVREHVPDGIEEYIDPNAAGNAELLDVVKAVFPQFIKSRIRQPVRDELLKEITETGGYLVDKDTGDKEKVAEVSQGSPTGAFAYRAGKGTTERIVTEWLNGRLAGVDLGGMLALPAAEAGGTDGA
jgi:hypothetical protein